MYEVREERRDASPQPEGRRRAFCSTGMRTMFDHERNSARGDEQPGGCESIPSVYALRALARQVRLCRSSSYGETGPSSFCNLSYFGLNYAFLRHCEAQYEPWQSLSDTCLRLLLRYAHRNDVSLQEYVKFSSKHYVPYRA